MKEFADVRGGGFNSLDRSGFYVGVRDGLGGLPCSRCDADEKAVGFPRDPASRYRKGKGRTDSRFGAETDQSHWLGGLWRMLAGRDWHERIACFERRLTAAEKSEDKAE